MKKNINGGGRFSSRKLSEESEECEELLERVI